MTPQNWLWRSEVERENPHDLDPLRADLDATFAGADPPMEGEIQWAMVLSCNAHYWEPVEYFKVEGVNWHISFFPMGDLDRPGTDEPYPFPTCLIACTTGVTGSTNAARNVGRLAVRQLVAIVYMKLPLLWGQAAVWEGPLWAREQDDRPVTGLNEVRFEVTGATVEAIRERLAPFVTLRAGAADHGLGLAYFWYSRAWAATDTIERFMNFWLASLALFERLRQDRGDAQRRVIERYVDDVMQRALSFSAQPRDDLVSAFDDAYGLRNELFHTGDRESVTADDVWSLETAVTHCIDLETRLAG